MEKNIKKIIKFIIGMIIGIIVIGAIVSFGYNRFNTKAAVIISIIVILIALKIYLQKNIKEEELFFNIVPVILIMFLIGIPSLKNPDEIVHWYKIYDISQGNIMAKTIDGTPWGHIPEEVQIDMNQTDINYTNLGKLYDRQIADDGEEVMVDLSTTSVYNPIVYMPQVVGTIIADIFTDRPLIMMYSARIFNLIFSVIILYLAIKIIPFGKRIMLLLTCIPVAASSFASMSLDAMTISIAYLLIAYILKLLYEKEKKIKLKDKVIVGALSIVIALCKIVYLPLVGLILLLPKEKYKSRKEHIITNVIIMGVAIISNLLWLGISSQYLIEYKDGSPVMQVQNILENPIEYIQMFLDSVNVYLKVYIDQLFGYGVGADLHIRLYSLLPVIILLLYMFETITDNKMKKQFNTFQKVIITLITLAIIALIFTSLYIQWTPINNTHIEGVQGRYFLPILPLISLLIGNSDKIKGKYDENKHNKYLRNNATNNICIYNVYSSDKQYVERK